LATSIFVFFSRPGRRRRRCGADPTRERDGCPDCGSVQQRRRERRHGDDARRSNVGPREERLQEAPNSAGSQGPNKEIKISHPAAAILLRFRNSRIGFQRFKSSDASLKVRTNRVDGSGEPPHAEASSEESETNLRL
jgi:hypothetical protein